MLGFGNGASLSSLSSREIIVGLDVAAFEFLVRLDSGLFVGDNSGFVFSDTETDLPFLLCGVVVLLELLVHVRPISGRSSKDLNLLPPLLSWGWFFVVAQLL